MSDTKQRITDTSVIPPVLKQLLLREYEAVEPERLEAIGALVGNAEEAEERFQQKAAQYQAALRAREAAAMRAVDDAALEILGDFEKSLEKSSAPATK